MPQVLLDKNEHSIKAWNEFIKTGKINNLYVRKLIADSWIRSKEYKVDPIEENTEIKLSKKELNKRYKDMKPVLDIAKPKLNYIYELVGDTGLMVRFSDKDGYVLEVLGNSQLDKYGNFSLQKGVNSSERAIGTNAIGLALIKKIPVQVLGGEHFSKQYHNWTSSACPIRDKNNEILGIISVTGPCDKVHPHTLGMVIAAADAIKNELELDKINKRLLKTNTHLFALMESISEGIIGIDSKGKIRDINGFAKKLLSYDNEIIGTNIKDKISFKSFNLVEDIIKSWKKYEEYEMYFKDGTGKKIYCIVNLTPIDETGDNKVDGVLLSFRKSKTIPTLVNRIVGAEAIFNFDDIIGSSKSIVEAKKIAKKAAKSTTTVLLHGESGTGKELFAQAIHNESPRKNKPFVFINCGAIPRELVASELFGYVEGAFTGAKRGGHPGKFELADEGTIFLDEIGDMPLDTQANLLRVLETKSIVRVGGHNVIPTDVRVIAATHKDLKEEVERGNFREDLYYRLNVMPITTPSLKERREDIKIFINYFKDKFSKKINKNISGISDDFYKYMKKYDWPGNVRELQNVMQLVVNMAEEDEVITYNHLPSYMKKNNLANNLNLKNELLTLGEIEKIAIEKTLEELSGNIALTSKVLGIGRTTLYRKIEKYKLGYIFDKTT
ncbi:MAG: sigma 54-interacting transcriptional regulator [Peptostreptococcaceae bacterium]|jgi:PAS domain S-box-containing protein|nr:sigma 54-interacting transcriptional regulator [Peptostreptococcaceae bacterium]